ncbi:MAG TPA: PQQ-dependent sugar dehydrogenase [Gammaproteobacteria bacterium]|nr:PQQ-dependent sugar dehydrogenase [Gammaproteobacteria bacterium]
MNFYIKNLGILLIIAGVPCPAAADAAPADVVEEKIETQYERIRVVRIIGGLENPWSVAFLPDGRFLVTERPGRLNIVAEGGATPVSGLPGIHAMRQGGLLDVSLHPDFDENGWVYLTYSKGDADGDATALGRGRLDGTRLVEFEELFVQDRASAPGIHYGSRIAWLADGTLLMSIGDRGTEPPRAQDPLDHAGKVLRLDADGNAPADNPFAGRDDVKPEVYTLGHRNIQGLVVVPDSGDVWAVEHGPRGGDELNRIRAGDNYGWPQVSRARDYRTQAQFGEARSREGFVDPVYEFLPTHAPSGLALVTRDRFPRWRGDLLVGGLRSERIRRVVLEDGEVVHEEELLLGIVGRIRDVREGPDGYIYVLSDESDGGLYRIEPASSP